MAQSQFSNEQLASLMKMLGLGTGLAGVGGGLYNLSGKGSGIPEAANKYLNQIPGAMQPYYQPYMSAGQNALGQLMGQYGQLTGSTGDVYNKLAGGYQESPGFQSALKQALGAAGNQAAAGGMSGTPQAQLQSADVAGTLSQQDFGDYMGRMMGLYNTGLSGLSGINQQGFGANTDYANMLGSLLGQQSQYAAMEKAMQNQKRSKGFGQLAGGLGALGGFFLGGPMGAAAGYGLGQGIGSGFGG
jgi:hypothetical protein